jgi:hypothetical protein
MAIDPEILAAIAAAAGESQSSPVWVKGTTKAAPDSRYLTLEQMQEDLYNQAALRSPEYSKIVQNMYAANFISKSQAGQVDSVANALSYPVQMYQAYTNRAGDQSVSFNKWFDWYVSTAKPREESGRRGGYSGPVTTVSTTLTDPTTAEAVLDKFSRDLLGRALTKKESDRYLKEYRDIEVENPQVTTTTPKGDARRETVTETAPSKEEMLRQVIAKNPDYQKYQIDTTIMDFLLDDIKAGQEVING